MRITYLAHGALHFEHGDTTLITDPWLNGPAYCNQWYQFPKPYLPDNLASTQLILYTHGHENHLHFPSLELFAAPVKIWYPYSWYGSARKAFAAAG